MDIDRVLAGERCGIGIGIIDGGAGDDAGVVDEDVEPAELFCHVLHQLLDFDGGGLVGLEGARLHALGFQLGHDRFGLVGGGDIADRDVGAFIGQRPGAGSADAARAAGDEGNLA